MAADMSLYMIISNVTNANINKIPILLPEQRETLLFDQTRTHDIMYRVKTDDWINPIRDGNFFQNKT